VIEIGRTLREAREQLGLGLDDVEAATRIRTTYLAALEQERFNRLPGRMYAKSFLREYAQFLGLDGDILVEAFNARVPEPEDDEPTPRQIDGPPRRLPRRLGPIGVGVLVVAAAAALEAWQLGGSQQSPPAARARTATTQPSTAPRPQPQKSVPAAVASHGHLLLRASGPCWLSIRSGSAGGPVIYEATLQAGEVLRYTLAPSRPRLWMRIGAPWNLELRFNGGPAHTLPAAPTNLLVAEGGIQSG
jgi:cytoskeletal protein RodZ